MDAEQKDALKQQLTLHQRQAVDAVEAALDRDGVAVFTGWAGSGKTHILAHYFLRVLPKPLALCPTNRACFVLRSKLPSDVSVPVMTVHAAAMRLREETHREAIRLWESLARCERDAVLLRRALESWKPGAKLDTSAVNRDEEARAQLIVLNAEDETPPPADIPQVIDRNLRRVRRANELKFEANDSGEASGARTVVVDEASMVSLKMRDHIMDAFSGVPILYVGDPAQLAPIVPKGEPPGSVLDALSPTAELTEIIRQQGDDHPDSPKRIALFANHIRQQTAAPFPNQWSGQVDTRSLKILTRPKSGITVGLLNRAIPMVEDDGIVLCWRNDTRRSFNRKLRKRLGLDRSSPLWLPVAGERLIVSGAPGQSAREEAQDPVTGAGLGADCTLTKGELFTLSSDASLVSAGSGGRGVQWVRLESATPGFGSEPLHVPPTPFLETYHKRSGSWYAMPRRDWFLFDFGWAATVHKSQGSQFKNVVVYEQFPFLPPTPEQERLGRFPSPDPEAHRRWLYTAITRAEKRLLLIAEPKKPRGWR